MSLSSRRSFLKILGSAGVASVASAPLFRAFADVNASSDEFFIFVHALGGWDVTLSLDPRFETRGLVDPASTLNTDTALIRNWEDDTVELEDGGFSFKPIRPAGTPFVFGPAIGNLKEHASRLCVVNGLATNTVSHFDGQIYAVTGRHLNGGRPNQASADVVMANELGVEQLLPIVSVQYPSYHIGRLDSRATPLRIATIGTIAKSLNRSNVFDSAAQRDNVSALLTEEAKDLAELSSDPGPMRAMALQYEGLRNMLAKDLKADFSAAALIAKHPELNISKLKFQAAGATNAAFAIEAFRKNVARCVSFTFTGFDTHFANYKNQALVQQEMFDTLATLLDQLDGIPHPTRPGAMLSDHTHILLTSDFCRTPQINLAGGRDHYPNGSALVISPKFKGGTLYGKSDPEQLLPVDAGTFLGGMRPVAPPDLLATFVSTFKIEPQKYLREGEVIKELVKA